MAKKFTLKIAPNFKLTLNPTLPIRKDRIGMTIDIVNALSKIIWIIFFLLVISSTLFSTDLGIGTYFFILVTIILQIFLHVVKGLLSKNDILPSIVNDIYFLIFTSVISFSLFINTILYKDAINIWGGKDFRAISGISMIAYWFLYYLVSINYSTKKDFKSILKLINFGVLISFVLGLLLTNTLPTDLTNILILLNPGLLILALSQKKLNSLYIVNFVLSTIIMFAIPAGIIQVIVFFFYFVTFIFLLIRKRRSLGMLLDGLNAKKTPLISFFKKNFTAILMLVSVVFCLIGIIWLLKNFNVFFFDKFIIGTNTLRFSQINNLLIGNGLLINYGSIFFQFFSTYGLLPVIGLLLLLYIGFKDVYLNIKTRKISKLGVNMFYISTLATFFLYLIFENTGVDILIAFIVIIFSLMSIQKQISIKELVYANDVRNFDLVKQENYKFFFKLLRIFAIIILFVFCIYLLSNLNYINIFIKN